MKKIKKWIIEWLREQMGVFMLSAHIDGLKSRIDVLERKNEELLKKVEIYEKFMLKEQQ